MKPILSPSIELWKPDGPAAKAADAVVANVVAGLKESIAPAVRGMRREAAAIGYTPDGGRGGHAGTECPDCGRQADPHAGHIGNGRVFVCEKGKPPMRGAVVSPEKCGPEGAGHD